MFGRDANRCLISYSISSQIELIRNENKIGYNQRNNIKAVGINIKLPSLGTAYVLIKGMHRIATTVTWKLFWLPTLVLFCITNGRTDSGLRGTMLLTVKAAELMQMLLQIDIEWLSVWNIMQFLRGKWKKCGKLTDGYVRFWFYESENRIHTHSVQSHIGLNAI